MKKFLSILLICILTLSLSACGGSPGGDTDKNSGESGSGGKTVINLVIGAAHSARALDYMESLDDCFKEEISRRVYEETDYEIQWTDAYGTVLTAAETLDGTRDGLVDICPVFVGACAGELPLHNFSFILPFACPDPNMCLDVTRQVYADYSAELIDVLETEFNQKLLGIIISPSYEIFSTVPIDTAAALSALKIGASGRNLLWLQDTGAVAVQANMTEAYTSLETGLITGTIQAPYWGVKANFQDLVKYVTHIGLGSSTGGVITINLDKWNSLPTEVQNIIADAGRSYEVYQANHAIETTELAYQQCKDIGIQVTEMSDAEKSAWLEKLPNIPDTAPELGSKGMEILEHYVQLLSDAGYEQPRQWEFHY